MKLSRYIPFVLLVLLPLVIGTAVAEPNQPEAVESLSNWEDAQKLTGLFNNTPNGAQRPIIAIAGNETLIVAYLKQQSADALDTDPFYIKSTDGGDTWTTPARIHTSGNTARQVHVAFDNNNKAHAVWTEDDNQLWYGNEDDWGGNSSTQLFSSADILIESPKIAVDGNGILHLVWFQADFTEQDVFYSRSNDGGNTWTTPVNVSNSPASSESPALAIDSENRANVVWEEQVGGSEYKINYSRRSPAGVWSTPVSLSAIVSSITSAREPDIAIFGSRLMVVFEDRVSLSQQTLFLLECSVNCTADPETSNQWRSRPATAQAFGAKDSDPTFLGPKVTTIGQCRTVVFSGIAGDPSTNDEKVRLGDSCNGFSTNPVIEAVENSLGTNERAIKPSVTVLNNWLVFVVYEQKGPSRSDIYLVRNQPAIYLPAINK